MRISLLLLTFVSMYGCASSSRVDILSDQINAQKIAIRTLEQQHEQDEKHMIEMHNRFANNEHEISQLSLKVDRTDQKVNSLTSKFDAKFQHQILK